MPRTYTIADVATALGVHQDTIRAELRRGQLKATRVGTKYVITMPDLAQYLGADRAASIFSTGGG